MAETARGDVKTSEATVVPASDEEASAADCDARGWRTAPLNRRKAQERLTSSLIEPIDHLLEQEQHLIILPEHHLRMLPFAALQVPPPNYFIESFSVRLAPSV